MAVLAAVTTATLGIAAPSALAQSCTGQNVSDSDSARGEGPFGREVVAPTAQTVDNFGQFIIRPEATAPHDNCP